MKIKLICLLLGCWCMTAFGQDITVSAQIDDSQPIYAGQRFKFYVVIDGDNTPGVVDETPLEPFDPRGPQVQDVSQSSVTTVNGRTTRQVVKRTLAGYDLAAGTAGQYTIPALSVSVGTVKYTTSPVSITVLTPETTDRIAITAQLSESKCYVGQPVVLTVKWYVRQAIAARVSDYMFTVPAFSSPNFIVEDVADTAAVANQGAANVGGVEVVVSQKAVKYDNNDCIEVSFSKVIMPQKSGSLELGKAGVLCKINMSQSRFSFQSEFKSFGADSEPLFLEVLPLPQEGRPDNFNGLIGKYDIKAQAQPVDVKVGDPITLKISVGGSRYLKPVQWPALESIKELSDNFILPTEQSSPEIVDGRKVFTQTIRAKNDKVTEIPAIPLACFDVESGKYITVYTEPVKLNVSPTKVLTLSDVESGSAVDSGRKLEARKGGISANYVGSELLADMSFDPQVRLFSMPDVFIWSLPAAIFLLSVLIKTASRDKEARAKRRLQKTAAKRSIAVLKKCLHTDGDKAKAMMAEAIREYFAARFDRSGGAITAHDCEQIIIQLTADEKIAASLAAILEKCEASQYSPLAVKFDSGWVDEVTAVIERVEKCVR